jgi:predicted outer membrane protein
MGNRDNDKRKAYSYTEYMRTFAPIEAEKMATERSTSTRESMIDFHKKGEKDTSSQSKQRLIDSFLP